MDRGLYVAMTGAKQIMQAQAVNNNNIANVEHHRLSRRRGVVHEPADLRPGLREPRQRGGRRCRHRLLERRRSSSSSRPLDIAVNGKGFIAVQGADGKEAYTRAGDLRVTADGAVVTATGLQVLSETGPLQVPPATQTTIGSDGTVSVVPLGLSAGGAVAGGPDQAGQPADIRAAKGRGRPVVPQVGRQGARPTRTVTVSSGALEVEQRQRRACRWST